MSVQEGSYERDQWSEDNLKEAMKKIDSGEITINEVENMYGIPARVIYRQKAKENIKAQLNPEKPIKVDSANRGPNIDYSLVTQPVQIGTSDLNGVVKILSSGTEEVKNVLLNECTVIYECKVCRALFRNIVNLLTHKRLHCVTYKNYCKENMDNDSCSKNSDNDVEEKLQLNQYVKDQVNRPNRRTCRTDLASILRRNEMPAVNYEPVLQLQPVDTNSAAFYQSLIPNISFRPQPILKTDLRKLRSDLKNTETINGNNYPISEQTSSMVASEPKVEPTILYGCPCCDKTYVLKKSVGRHLKEGHRKNNEEIATLKSKIKEITVIDKGNKTATDELIKSGGKIGTVEAGINNDIRLICYLCGKIFGYKKTLRIHLKQTCPKRYLFANPSTGNYRQLIGHNNNNNKNNAEDDNCNNNNNNSSISEKNKVVDVNRSDDSDKLLLIPTVSIPLLANPTRYLQRNSPQKKIAIQVRMDYCKDKNEYVADVRNVAQSSVNDVVLTAADDTIGTDESYKNLSDCNVVKPITLNNNQPNEIGDVNMHDLNPCSDYEFIVDKVNTTNKRKIDNDNVVIIDDEKELSRKNGDRVKKYNDNYARRFKSSYSVSINNNNNNNNNHNNSAIFETVNFSNDSTNLNNSRLARECRNIERKRKSNNDNAKKEQLINAPRERRSVINNNTGKRTGNNKSRCSSDIGIVNSDYSSNVDERNRIKRKNVSDKSIKSSSVKNKAASTVERKTTVDTATKIDRKESIKSTAKSRVIKSVKNDDIVTANKRTNNTFLYIKNENKFVAPLSVDVYDNNRNNNNNNSRRRASNSSSSSSSSSGINKIMTEKKIKVNDNNNNNNKMLNTSSSSDDKIRNVNLDDRCVSSSNISACSGINKILTGKKFSLVNGNNNNKNKILNISSSSDDKIRNVNLDDCCVSSSISGSSGINKILTGKKFSIVNGNNNNNNKILNISSSSDGKIRSIHLDGRCVSSNSFSSIDKIIAQKKINAVVNKGDNIINLNDSKNNDTDHELIKRTLFNNNVTLTVLNPIDCTKIIRRPGPVSTPSSGWSSCSSTSSLSTSPSRLNVPSRSNAVDYVICNSDDDDDDDVDVVNVNDNYDDVTIVYSEV